MERSIDRRRMSVLLLLCCFLFSPARAQHDDFGMWYEVGAEKKLSRKWNVGAEAEFRTRNNTRTADRWSAGLSAEYKLAKGYVAHLPVQLKASAGYTLIYDNNPEKLTFNSSGDPKKWTPSYWGLRHRLNVSLAGSVEWGRLSLGLRERWQYTYRPSAADKRYAFQYDDDDVLTGSELQDVKGKGKNVLRSRFTADYNIRRCKVDPFAGIELFHDKDGLQKVRYQVGADYKLSKQHVFSLTYRYQNVGSDDDDNDQNSHLIGLSYKFKF